MVLPSSTLIIKIEHFENSMWQSCLLSSLNIKLLLFLSTDEFCLWIILYFVSVHPLLKLFSKDKDFYPKSKVVSLKGQKFEIWDFYVLLR